MLAETAAQNDASTDLDFAAFAARVLATYRPPFAAASTHQRMAQIVKLLASSGVTSVADLTPDRLADWSMGRLKAISQNTLIGELGYVRALCGAAVEEGLLERNPLANRRMRLRAGPPRRKIVHHPAEDVAKVLAHLAQAREGFAGGRLWALVGLVAFTGLRRNEALRMRVEDVDVEAGFADVVARTRLKTIASAAPVPLPPPLQEILRDWLPRTGSEWLIPTLSRKSPWIGGAPGTKPLDRVKQAGAACGVEGLTLLSLRHSWATHAESAWGLSDGVIQRVLRHTTPLTSKRHYRHPDLANLRDAVKHVDYSPKTEASNRESA